jgi:hypothetical protein
MWYGMISGVAGLKPRAHFDALGLELADFLLQRGRRQHDPVADQAQHVLAHDPGRDQMQHGLLAADDQRVAGVVPTLEARDRTDLLGQQVDDLALAFVVPLGTEDDD